MDYLPQYNKLCAPQSATKKPKGTAKALPRAGTVELQLRRSASSRMAESSEEGASKKPAIDTGSNVSRSSGSDGGQRTPLLKGLRSTHSSADERKMKQRKKVEFMNADSNRIDEGVESDSLEHQDNNIKIMNRLSIGGEEEDGDLIDPIGDFGQVRNGGPQQHSSTGTGRFDQAAYGSASVWHNTKSAFMTQLSSQQDSGKPSFKVRLIHRGGAISQQDQYSTFDTAPRKPELEQVVSNCRRVGVNSSLEVSKHFKVNN